VEKDKYRKWTLRNVRERETTGREPGDQINLTKLDDNALQSELQRRAGIAGPGKNASRNQQDLSGKLLETIEIPTFSGKFKRIVEIEKLAEALFEKLKGSGMGKNEPFENFTSAEFAVQMTESPGRVTIQVRP
jgi:hypothetical protein